MHSLKLLGGVSLTGEGGPVAGPAGQRKRLALLVLLAATPERRMSRDKIIAMLWPESDGAKARHLLADAVYELRSAIGKDAIRNIGDDLVLDPDLVATDLDEFQRALRAGRLADAAAGYRGPFLDGFFFSDAPEFERWAEEQRMRLEHDYVRALESLAEERAAAGDHRGAVAWWRKVAAQDPLSSRVALCLMRALAAAGDPAAAVHHARAHELLLREELNAAPDPEVTALARRLQSLPSIAPLASASSPVVTRSTIPREAGTSFDPPEPLPPAFRADGAVDAVPGHRAEHPREAGRFRRSRLRPLIGLGALVLAVAAVAMVVREPVAMHEIRSIAVLPLENLSGDSAEYIAEGVTDGLIIELHRMPGLDIISRTSTVRFKRTQRDMPTLARDLNVDGIVRGTVRRDGGRIQVDVRLVHGPSDTHVWDEHFESPMNDLLALEREIAEEIAEHAGVATKEVDAPLRRSSRSVDPIAMDLYLRGRQAWHSRNAAGIRQAMVFYKGALERDPEFALAHAGLADAYRFYGGLNYGPTDAYRDSAHMSASRAISLDNTLSEAHASLAALLTDAGLWESAERGFQLAIAVGPSNAPAHHWYAILLASHDRKPDALRMIRRAHRLDPYSAPLTVALGQIEAWAGVQPDKRTRTARGDEVDPTNANAHAANAVRLAQRDKCAGADSAMVKAREWDSTGATVGAAQVAVHWFCREPDRARAALSDLERRPDAGLNTIYIAMAHTAMGQSDSAFAWLDRERSWGMRKRFELRVSPYLQPLRSDARYDALLRKVGLQ